MGYTCTEEELLSREEQEAPDWGQTCGEGSSSALPAWLRTSSRDSGAKQRARDWNRWGGLGSGTVSPPLAAVGWKVRVLFLLGPMSVRALAPLSSQPHPPLSCRQESLPACPALGQNQQGSEPKLALSLLPLSFHLSLSFSFFLSLHLSVFLSLSLTLSLSLSSPPLSSSPSFFPRQGEEGGQSVLFNPSLQGCAHSSSLTASPSYSLLTLDLPLSPNQQCSFEILKVLLYWKYVLRGRWGMSLETPLQSLS